MIGLSSTGLALARLAVAHTSGQMLSAVAAVGLALEIYETATTELLARVTTGPQRQDAYAAFGGWLVAAGAVAGLLAAALLPLGVRWLLTTDAATCLAAAFVAWWFLRRRPKIPSRPDRGRRDGGHRRYWSG